MAKTSVPRKPRPTKDAQKPRTLADFRLAHTVGSHTKTYSGETIARLIDATRHLHDRDAAGDDLEFIEPYAIAVELRNMAEVLSELAGEEPCALGYFVDQLQRLSNRVAATAPRSGNSAPDWFKVEVAR